MRPSDMTLVQAANTAARATKIVDQKTPEQVKAFHEEQAKLRAEERERAKARAAAGAKSAEQEAERNAARDRAVVEGALCEILGTDPHEEIDELDRRACVAWLAARFREMIEVNRQRRSMFKPAAPRAEPVPAWVHFDGALVVVLNVKHGRMVDVQIGAESYRFAPGLNYLPADVADLGALEAMIDRGQAILHPPGAPEPEVSADVLAAREEAIRNLGGA